MIDRLDICVNTKFNIAFFFLVDLQMTKKEHHHGDTVLGGDKCLGE